MKTLVSTSVIVCMALAIVCMTAPLGNTQGVETSIGKCPPGASWTDRPCVDIKNNGRQKPAMEFSGAGKASAWGTDIKGNGEAKPAWPTVCGHIVTGTGSAHGQAPSWCEDGQPDLSFVRPGSTTPPSGGFGSY